MFSRVYSGCRGWSAKLKVLERNQGLICTNQTFWGQKVICQNVRDQRCKISENSHCCIVSFQAFDAKKTTCSIRCSRPSHRSSIPSRAKRPPGDDELLDSPTSMPSLQVTTRGAQIDRWTYRSARYVSLRSGTVFDDEHNDVRKLGLLD